MRLTGDNKLANKLYEEVQRESAPEEVAKYNNLVEIENFIKIKREKVKIFLFNNITVLVLFEGNRP